MSNEWTSEQFAVVRRAAREGRTVEEGLQAFVEKGGRQMLVTSFRSRCLSFGIRWPAIKGRAHFGTSTLTLSKTEEYKQRHNQRRREARAAAKQLQAQG